MDSEGAFEREAEKQRKQRSALAIKYLEQFSKEHASCGCGAEDYTDLEMALALAMIEAMETLQEIGGLIPKGLMEAVTEEGK